MEKKGIFDNQSGVTAVTFALLLVVLLGFTGLAVDAGKWYLTKAELSKAVDAAALAAAKNISNPNVDLDDLVQEVASANFYSGYIGTPGSEEEGAIKITSEWPNPWKVRIEATVRAPSWFARLFGTNYIDVGNQGSAARNEVEIMMVLDRSGSMSGQLDDLKVAAKGFLDFFEETQDEDEEETQNKDKMGLITFATGVTVDCPLGTDIIEDMKSAIDAITAGRDTNMEDAIDRSDDEASGGFTDQTDDPGDQRINQFLIFFSDGMATAFRGDFTRNGDPYDAVVPDPGDVDRNYLGDPWSGEHVKDSNGVDVRNLPTGDGKPLDETQCEGLTRRDSGPYENTKWHVFEEGYPIDDYGSEDCNIGGTDDMRNNNVMRNYVYATAEQMAIDHAKDLKDNGIMIYCIGLGTGADQDLLKEIASDPVSGYYYYAPDSDDLKAIFNRIAKEIKLRLVE